MRIPSINLNLFQSKSISKVAENQQNPFVANNTNNPFAGGLKADVFQNSSIENIQATNFLAQKSAEIIAGWNNGIATFKNNAKEFFAPVISFAGSIRAGYNRLNEITLGDLYAGFKKEISMLSLDKDVRKYVKMPVADLRNELAQELNA